jgi:diguanylate cyclase (GGDEF)-like protein
VFEFDNSTWLCQSDFDRQRLVEATMTSRTLRRSLMFGLQILSLCFVPLIGWPPFVAILIGTVIVEVSELGLRTAKRPEYRIFAGWVGMLLNVAVLVVAYGKTSVALVPIFTAMLMPLIGVYPIRVLALGATVVMAVELTVGFLLIGPITKQVTLTTMASVAVTAVIALGVVTLVRSDEAYRQKSVIDPLTGLLNRRSLESRVAELVAKADFRSLSMAVLVFDLDHFKAINDTYGHDVGDQVLRRSSDAMQVNLRSSDAIFRIGGEEFLAVLLDVDDGMAFQLADGVRKGVEQSGDAPAVTVSAGLATHAGPGQLAFDDLFRLADAALLAAKGSGRNQVKLSGGHPPVDSQPQRRTA